MKTSCLRFEDLPSDPEGYVRTLNEIEDLRILRDELMRRQIDQLGALIESREKLLEERPRDRDEKHLIELKHLIDYSRRKIRELERELHLR